MAEKKELSEVLKGKFTHNTAFAPGKYVFMGSTIDTSTCDVATAEEAVKNGFDILVPVKASVDVKK